MDNPMTQVHQASSTSKNQEKVNQASPTSKSQKKNPHSGHRERMRQRFFATGIEGFASHEVLEFLLFFAQPRCNTNEIAHALIEAFGSLPGVFEASYDELKSVSNVGEASATLISLFPQLFKRYSMEKETCRETFDSMTRLSGYCRSLFVGATEEQAYLLLFDNSMHILDCTLLAHGTVNQVPLMTRKIAERALEKHAACAVITHNHPNGLALPSAEDLAMTDTVEAALALFEIPLLEHVLVANSVAVPLIYRHKGIDRPTLTGTSVTQASLKAFYGEIQ
ncbi:MAG: hypothetical protein E7661_07640 [Ruminococcaceae bacterium]|nr:hypothetical protein [Oscillospiraceae bacterium]